MAGPSQEQPNLDNAGIGDTGLVNEHWTCYLNAMFQCLAHTIPLSNYFITNEAENQINWENEQEKEQAETRKNALIAYYFGLFVRQFWSNKFTSLRLKLLKDQLATKNTEFQTGSDGISEQCDVNEVYMVLIESIHDALKKTIIIEQQGSSQGIKCIVSVQTLEWNRWIGSNASRIQELFYFQIAQSRRERFGGCDCDRSPFTFQVHNYLGLHLHGLLEENPHDDAVTLDDLLKMTFNQIQISSSVVCEEDSSCNRPYFQSYTCKLWNPPKILVILLMRYTATTRLPNQIIFPFDLDMSRYIHTKNQKDITTGKSKPSKYSLYGVIFHHGENRKKGHYTAYVKRSDDTDEIGWQLFDDNTISKPDLNPAFENMMYNDAYMLFYRRIEESPQPTEEPPQPMDV